MTSNITLTQPGQHVFKVPSDVYSLDVTCYGHNGKNTLLGVNVQPNQDIGYYIENQGDTETTYFGPYICAHDDDNQEYIPHIDLTLYNATTPYST